MREKKWSYYETRLKIKSDKDKSIESAIDTIIRERKKLERFIYRKPEFRNSLEPLNLHEDNYSGIIRLMLRASKIAGTGPFAAVAGSISQIGKEEGIKKDAVSMVIDNGGDIAIEGNRNFLIAIYAGSSLASEKFAFSIDSDTLPLGVCTSSASVGHSVSLGEADAVTVVAKEASIADAAATEIANKVSGNDVELSIKKGLDRADDILEIRGCLIIRDNQIGTVGKLPQILSLTEEDREKARELVIDSLQFIE